MSWSVKRWAGLTLKEKQPFQYYAGNLFLYSNIALFQIKLDINISLYDLCSDILCHKLLPYGVPDSYLFSLLQITLTNLISAFPISAQFSWEIKTRLVPCSQDERHWAFQRSLFPRKRTIYSKLPQDAKKPRFKGLILPKQEARNYSIAYTGFRNKMWYNSPILLSDQVLDIIFHWDIIEKFFQYLQNSSPDIGLTHLMCPLSCLEKPSPI